MKEQLFLVNAYLNLYEDQNKVKYRLVEGKFVKQKHFN